MKSVISVSDLSKYFGKTVAVDRVSFSVEKGEVVGFVGLNGAGKTTTIAMMLGFIHASQGKVKILGQTITPSSAHKAHADIGYASGDMSLPGNMTGEQYLNFVEANHKTEHHSQRQDLTRRFKPQLGRKLSTLSRGNRQKIALIAAFLTRPQLVILDEPTSGLDPMMQEAFLELIEHERQRGTTIFMSSHYLEEVAEVCSRVLVLRDGKLVKDVASSEITATQGKQVKLVTKRAASVPMGAASVKTSRGSDSFITEFVYTGSASKLLTWLSAQRGVQDVTVRDNSVDEALRQLYGAKDANKKAEKKND